MWPTNELDGILGHFHKVHRKLESYIDRVSTVISNKAQLKSELDMQIANHKIDIYTAQNAKEQVAKIIGKM